MESKDRRDIMNFCAFVFLKKIIGLILVKIDPFNTGKHEFSYNIKKKYMS